jgi:hypothetical protein
LYYYNTESDTNEITTKFLSISTFGTELTVSIIYFLHRSEKHQYFGVDYKSFATYIQTNLDVQIKAKANRHSKAKDKRGAESGC